MTEQQLGTIWPARFAVELTSDVRYGAAGVKFGGRDGAPVRRDLLMDIYRPLETGTPGRRAAVVLAFGGAYHRGSKEDDTVPEGDIRNTSIADYCHHYAALGYVTFSIGYRLTSEDPDPGEPSIITEPEAVSRSRVDHVRQLLGLGPASNQMIADGMTAAARDVAAAFRFIHENATAYGIDQNRMAVGGFSAGASSALYAVFALNIPAAALVVLSGRMEAADIPRYVRGQDQPPVLHIFGESDLEYVLRLTPVLEERYTAVGLQHSIHQVPGVGHFYPHSSETIGPDGAKASVQNTITSFLEKHLASGS